MCVRVHLGVWLFACVSGAVLYKFWAEGVLSSYGMGCVCVMGMIQRALWDAGMQSRHGVLRRQFGLHVPPGLHETHLLFTHISYCYRSVLPSRPWRIFHNCIFVHCYPQYYLLHNTASWIRWCDKERISKKLFFWCPKSLSLINYKLLKHVTLRKLWHSSAVFNAGCASIIEKRVHWLCSPGRLWVAGRLGARKRLCRTWTTSASCSPPWRASRPTSSPPCRSPATRAPCLTPLSHPSASTPPHWSSSHTTGTPLRCVHCNYP